MAYSTANPPSIVAGGIGSGARIWAYVSADVHTDVDATDYFTNGDELGMKVNDIVMVVDTTAGLTAHRVSAVTTGGAATIAQATLA